MKKTIFTVCMLLVCMLSSCAENDMVQKKAAEPVQSEESGSIYLKIDNYGRELVIEKRPKKVLTLGPNCTELFVTLGLEDFIIGTSLKNHSRGPLPEYEDIYEHIPELNYGSAVREAVISSGADFIYGIDWEFGQGGLDINELENYGITIYINRAATLEEQYKEIEDLGKIFGIEDRAREYIEDQKRRIEAVLLKADGKDKPGVLVYDGGSNGIFTCGGNNFESLLIEKAGGENIFADITDKQWTTVSCEEAAAREPDVIVIHDYDSPSVEEKIEEIKSNAILSQLECVKNEKFVTIELESVLPGNRMAYAIERFSEVFLKINKI